MSVWMVGIDHNSAALDVRSGFSFTKKRMREAYAAFRTLQGLSGCVILSTCNRMEWWISAAEGAAFRPDRELCAFLGLDHGAYGKYLCQRRDGEAVRHLFRLTAGLESQIVGEDQILTQVGEALQFARSAYATDNTLEVLFRCAVTGGKRVKTETVLSSADSSIIHTALRTLETQGLRIAGMPCMVIGNGMMGRLSAQTLLDWGADVTVTVRQYTSGLVDIPRCCKRINYAQRYDFLPSCALVVSATSSPNYTLCASELARLSLDHPICLVDLAVPRDIEAAAGQLPHVTLYDLDDFHMDQPSQALRQNLAAAEAILAQEQAAFERWYGGLDVVPRIQALKTSAAQDVSARLTPAYRRIPLQEAQKMALEQDVQGAAERMMNRLLFGMRSRLPDHVFLACMEAMESVFDTQSDGEKGI